MKALSSRRVGCSTFLSIYRLLLSVIDYMLPHMATLESLGHIAAHVNRIG